MDWFAEHWLDLLGWLGSVLLVVSLLQTRVLRFRVLNLAACLSLVVFNALIEVWPMVGMNLATSTINVWFLVRLLRDRHDERAFHVLQVLPQDAYFQHFLGRPRRRHPPDPPRVRRRRGRTTSPSRWRRATRPSAWC